MQRLFRMTRGTCAIFAAAGLGLALLSCGKEPPKSPDADAAGPDQQANALAAEPEDTTPLEPAPAPTGVFVRARVRSPGALLAAMGDAASSPLDLRRLLTDADARVRQVLQRVVDIDGPVEGIIALHPVSGEEPMAVWSVSARGVRSALQGLDAENIDVRPGPDGLHYFLLSDEPCALGRSLGKSPARIVCADRSESLDSLKAYALRGFPTEPLSDAEVGVRVIAEPLQKQYGKQLRGLRLLAGVGARQLHRDSPRFDSAVSDALLGLVDELVATGEDVHGLSFDLWDRQGAFESDLSLQFAGATSWLVPTLRDWQKQQGPAPELARQVPADATFTGYYRQLPKKATQRLAHVVGELGAGALESKGVSRSSADRLARTLTLVLAADRTVVHAGGPLKAGSATGAPTHLAWNLVGVDQAKKDVLEILDGFAATLSDKQFAKLDIDPEHRPHLARSSQKLGSGLSAAVYEWRLPGAVVSALTEGSKQLAEEGVQAVDSANLQQLERGYLAVMASGGSTWIAIATDRQGLIDSLTKVQADIPRITSKPELAGFLEEPALAMNFVRLAGLVDQLAPMLTPGAVKTSQQVLAVAPHRGAFPVTNSVSVKTGALTEVVLHTRVPDEFLTDSAALILAFSAEKKQP